MPEISYGTSAYQRDRGDLPELPLINMMVEQSKSAEKGVVLQSRPGLESNSTNGTGSIDGIFKADGVFSGDLFSVSGTAFYRAGVLIGAIDGSGPVSFAATGDDDDFDDQVLITRGASLWIYTVSGLAAVTFPDAANVIKIAFLNNRFLALKANSQRFYWSAVGNGASWDGLSFASAEKAADVLIDIIVMNDLAVLIGAETTEFWQSTTNADLPYQPITGRVFNKGGYQTGASVNYDNTAAFVSEENIAYLFDGDIIPKRISDNGIEERIENSATVNLFAFFWEGHELLCIRLDNGTWSYDVSTGQWCEFQSYGKVNWLVQCASGGLFGSSELGNILQFSAAHSDLGGVLERRFRGGFALNGGAVRLNNVRLRVNSGQTPNLTGIYTDPSAEIRISRDAGQTFDTWRSEKIGVQGQYRKRVEWRALGMADEPGFLAEFRCTDPVPFRISGVAVNEQLGGRSR